MKWIMDFAFVKKYKFKQITFIVVSPVRFGIMQQLTLNMRNKLTSDIYKLKATRTTEEKIELMHDLQLGLINHVYNKATRSNRFYQIYKYASIVLAAITSIISSLQIIYSSSFPQWILPVASAGTTVAVAFLGASSAQKIWIHSPTTQQRFQAEQFLFNQNAGMYSNLSKEECIKNLQKE